MQCRNYVARALSAAFAGVLTVVTTPRGPAALDIAGCEDLTLTPESATEARKIPTGAGEARHTESPTDTRRAPCVPQGIGSDRKCAPCSNRDQVSRCSQMWFQRQCLSHRVSG